MIQRNFPVFLSLTFFAECQRSNKNQAGREIRKGASKAVWSIQGMRCLEKIECEKKRLRSG